MTTQDLDNLETQFGFSLPAPYRDFLLNYPDQLREAKTDFGHSVEFVREKEFCDAFGTLQYLNDSVREPGTPWTEDDGPWPDQYFVIGFDGCGGYWAIDVKNTDSSVLYYDHDSGSYEKEYPTLQEYAVSCIQNCDEWNNREH